MAVLCSNCQPNQVSMSMWMIHLANYHPLPAVWLSDRAKMLTDEENRRPYTVVTDSRKRRRRPTDPRPLNTFMIFSRHIRRNILAVFPDASNSLVSKELGLLWKGIAHNIKSCYEEEAKRLAQLHAQEFPDYKYQPKKRPRRYDRVLYDRQVSPTNISHISSTATDEEETIRERDNRSSSDIENQYYRYSIHGKSLVKQCQNFNSPLKSDQTKISSKIEIKQEEIIQKPFTIRLTNFGDSNLFMRQSRTVPSSNVYIIPSENFVSSSTCVTTQLLGEDRCGGVAGAVHGVALEHAGVDEEIDITGNIFSNDLDLEWCEYNDDDDDGRREEDLSNLNAMF